MNHATSIFPFVFYLKITITPFPGLVNPPESYLRYPKIRRSGSTTLRSASMASFSFSRSTRVFDS